MLKIKNIIILVISILLLCGCDKDINISNEISIETYCDKKYGVEYIRDTYWRHGGITVRLDSNGNVLHCK